MSENTFKITGELLTDSPKLWFLLHRTLDAAEIPEIVKSYQTSVLKGAAKEHPVIRSEGVSYNPKPARILDLLIREGGIKDVALLKSALEEMCDELRTEPKKVAPIVELAILLDKLRHLHMSSLTHEQQLSEALMVQAKLENHLADFTENELYKKTVTILNKTLARTRRNLNSALKA